MRTLIVVEMKGYMFGEFREDTRKKLMKELEEGLIIIDEGMTVTSHTIQGEIGLEFNKEGKNEEESI